MEHLDTFLTGHPPFDSIDPAVLTEIARGAEQRTFLPGDAIMVEDGPPTLGLWVLLEGSIELQHQGETIQVLEPGESFGHPSLLTGMAPAFTVRAREACVCALIGYAAARSVLGTEAGAAYVARTMRARLTQTGHTVHGLLDVGTTPVTAIMRPPLFCPADATIRTAATALGEPGVAGLLVQDGAELGIVTDADVRHGLVQRELGLDEPVALILRTPAPHVPGAQLAVEAAVDMLAAGADCVAVVDAGSRPIGILSAADLVGLDARSPIALRHTIMGAADEAGLIRSVSLLPKLFRHLIAAGVPSRDVGRVLSLQHDAIVERLIDFSISRHGPAPVSWAWLDLGSAARREFTLASDQDNALAYAGGGPDDVDAYFAQLGADVNAGLARCGIGVDNNGVLAGQRLWRMSKADWVLAFDECFQIPDESHLIRASVAFDFRTAAGGLSIAADLSARIRAARQYPDFMRLMARAAVGAQVALGRRGQLAPEKGGEAAGRIDLKRGAIVPLVNLVRFHALGAGVTISPTLDRIEAVASVGGIERETADALAEAFGVITRLRFEHHAAQIAAGLAPDNLIDLGALAPIARVELREALGSVRRAQRVAAVWAGLWL